MEVSKFVKYYIRDDVNLIKSGLNEIQVKSKIFTSRRVSLSNGGIDALEKLESEGGTEDELMDIVINKDGFDGLIQFTHFLKSLENFGFIKYKLVTKKDLGISIIPSTPDFILQSFEINYEQYYCLSPFCYVRQKENTLILETPLSPASMEITNDCSFPLIFAFYKPVTCNELLIRFPHHDLEDLTGLINFLLSMKAIEEQDSDKSDKQVSDVDQWEFHDLLFHSRSRMGRHNNGFGGTYRYKELVEKLPAVKPEMGGKSISLKIPDLSWLLENDISLTAAIEQRKSVRNYGERPITINQLGEFLYRVARIKYVATMEDGYEVCGKPTPAGGAINELEVYPIINKCQGIDSGIYYYAAKEHKLILIKEKDQQVDQFLNLAWITATKQSELQVLFVITARFQRLSYKYESLVYSLILKHIGVLYQNMYLVATAMGLAPCALGGGDSDLFAKVSGLNYYQEGSVGEFLLGSQNNIRNK